MTYSPHAGLHEGVGELRAKGVAKARFIHGIRTGDGCTHRSKEPVLHFVERLRVVLSGYQRLLH